ncbi:MAG: polysaccharide deacetylase family protein [Bacteroidota bacterium]
MTLVKPPCFVRLLTQRYIKWSIPTNKPILYLTFDDGPHPEVTPAVLEILNQFQVKSTFFCIGKNVEENISVFENLKKQGHAVGNHTYSHMNGWNVSSEEYCKDIERCSSVFQSRLFRPPYGRIRRKQAIQLSKQFEIIGWSVLSRDYDQRESKESCAKNVTKAMKSGSVIVFHDSMKAKENVLGALPLFLKASIDKGYRFETLENEINGKK